MKRDKTRRESESMRPRSHEAEEAKVEARHGEKSDFRKISVTLPPAAYKRLVKEAARRKIAGERNHLLSAIIREAVDKYLERS